MTEARLDQLHNRASEVLGADEAETMMEAMREGMRGDLATSGEVRESALLLRSELQAEGAALRSELRAMEQRMTRTFVGWLLTSQAAFTATVAVFFSVAG